MDLLWLNQYYVVATFLASYSKDDSDRDEAQDEVLIYPNLFYNSSPKISYQNLFNQILYFLCSNQINHSMKKRQCIGFLTMADFDFGVMPAELSE